MYSPNSSASIPIGPRHIRACLFDGARLTLYATASRELWYEYDAEGAPAFLVSKTASAVHRYAFVTDAFGRILALVGVGEAGHASYSYDEWGAPALSGRLFASNLFSSFLVVPLSSATEQFFTDWWKERRRISGYRR